MVTFNTWLGLQSDRDDPVGDLARDAASDPDWPDVEALDRLQDHIIGAANAGSPALPALERAWAEWETAV